MDSQAIPRQNVGRNVGRDMGLNKLSARRVTTAPEGMWGDGGGLWLVVRPNTRSWVFRYRSPVTGKTREMGLGIAKNGGLADVRATAEQHRATLRDKRDPLDDREAIKVKAEGEQTFAEVSAAYIKAHEAGWKSAKHGAQWGATLKAYAYPHFGDRPVGSVSTPDVMRALDPIWTRLPETATRLRGRVEAILDYAAAKGWRSGENPARWRGHVAHMLPRRSKVARVVHHPAVSHGDLGAVMSKLALGRGTSALAVQFTVLTAARSGEVRGAVWAEVDLKERVWTVPAERMKAGREHRVPLSSAALLILKRAATLRTELSPGDYVFPGGRAARPLSDVALSNALAVAAGPGFTVHGLRSTFRDWVGETTAFPGDVAEAALAHTVRDKVEAAYRRGDLFDKRRAVMDAWGVFALTLGAVGNNRESLVP